MSAGLSPLETFHSQQQSALALGSSELHVKIGDFVIRNSDPKSLKCQRLPRRFRVTSAGVSGCFHVNGYTWCLTELISYLNAVLTKSAFFVLTANFGSPCIFCASAKRLC